MMGLTGKFASQWLTEKQNATRSGNYETAMAYKDDSGQYDFMFAMSISQMQTPFSPFEAARQTLTRKTDDPRGAPNFLVVRPSDHYKDCWTIAYFGDSRVPTDTRPAIWSLHMEVSGQAMAAITDAVTKQPEVIEELFLLTPFGNLTHKFPDGTPRFQRDATNSLLMISVDSNVTPTANTMYGLTSDAEQYITRYLQGQGNETSVAERLDIKGIQLAEFGRSVGETPAPPTNNHSRF
jgi:hypothetical protein